MREVLTATRASVPVNVTEMTATPTYTILVVIADFG
jgi:hypothetical protein